MKWPSTQFLEGIDGALKSAGISEDTQDAVRQLALAQTRERINCAAINSDSAPKEAAGGALPAFISAAASELSNLKRGAMEKQAYVRERSCTDSDGNAGNYVVLSENGRELGCHGKRGDAVKQLQAIEAHKNASEKQADIGEWLNSAAEGLRGGIDTGFNSLNKLFDTEMFNSPWARVITGAALGGLGTWGLAKLLGNSGWYDAIPGAVAGAGMGYATTGQEDKKDKDQSSSWGPNWWHGKP